jgi:hypothetical protein
MLSKTYALDGEFERHQQVLITSDGKTQLRQRHEIYWRSSEQMCQRCEDSIKAAAGVGSAQGGQCINRFSVLIVHPFILANPKFNVNGS